MKNAKKIHIVDYGLGNIASVVNMFKKLGVGTVVTSDPKELLKSDKVLLPGVGAFGAAMGRIDTSSLTDILKEKAIIHQVPFLGICLGMQLLASGSEESPGVQGLGLIPGNTLRFPQRRKLKVPHMGWNYVSVVNPNNLTKGILPDSRFYFVHSYRVVVENPDSRMLATSYGNYFDSGICNGNIFGVQFHPEKSHKFGAALLRSFAEI